MYLQQSGASRLAKHGGAYFSAVYGSIKDQIAALGALFSSILKPCPIEKCLNAAGSLPKLKFHHPANYNSIYPPYHIFTFSHFTLFGFWIFVLLICILYAHAPPPSQMVTRHLSNHFFDILFWLQYGIILTLSHFHFLCFGPLSLSFFLFSHICILYAHAPPPSQMVTRHQSSHRAFNMFTFHISHFTFSHFTFHISHCLDFGFLFC